MFDLILKGGRIYDGSGLPSFNGDIAISDGRIKEIGRINAAADQMLDISGLAVAPGIIDFHTHFDAQLWWDPLASSSNEHGVTSVVMGNCGLTLAPCKPESRDALIGTFVRVEDMPRQSLQSGIPWEWTTHGEFLDALARKPLGLNVATLVGNCAVRQYAMGEASVEREANDAEIAEMEELVRQGMRAGAFGFSTNANQRHYREDGKPVSSRFAGIDEIARLCRVVGEARSGLVQFTHGAFASPEHVAHIGQWYDTILKETRRPLIGESIRHFWNEPDLWRKQLHDVEERCRQGYAAYAMTSTRRAVRRWTLKDSTRFDEMPAWKNVMTVPLDLRKEKFRDPQTRLDLVQTMAASKPISFSRRWDLISIRKTARPENKAIEGKNIEELAKLQSKSPIDAFLDLALAEDLETTFEDIATQGDLQAVKEIFNNPHVLLGQSDAGAHVASGNPGFGYATIMLSHWVRKHQIMTLEDAIKKMTFLPASLFGIHDRGLLRPGLAADIFVFDPATIDLLPPEKVADLPEHAPRYIQRAKGIHYSIVNGSVLMKNGSHTGKYPGKVLRSA
ncbi:MAG TPA: amidohydrolase family protein [Candidatus Limnocylindria bacterium]|nr:amidohydrolase family protein [Candidatus Limnocylindria bacterium]